jgi:hypothetical protein
LAVTIIYPILDLVGFVAKPGAHNTPAAIRGLEMCYLFAPIILVVVGSACLIGYKLDARRQSEIRAKLDQIAGAEGLIGPGEAAAAECRIVQRSRRAISMNTWAAALPGAVGTIGSPVSPASRSATSMGI